MMEAVVTGLCVWAFMLTWWVFQANRVVRYQRDGHLLDDLDVLDRRLRALEGAPQYLDVRVIAPTEPEQ